LFSSHSVCVCVCVWCSLHFFCFFLSFFVLSSRDKKFFVFVFLDLTAQPFFGLAHKKTKLCSLPVCAFFLSFFFFRKKISILNVSSSLSTQKKNICLFCLSSDFLFVQLTDLCVYASKSSFLFSLLLLFCFCLFVSRENNDGDDEKQANLSERKTERSCFYTTNKRFKTFSLAENICYFVLSLQLQDEHDSLVEILGY
jgi:hypothetical protein